MTSVVSGADRDTRPLDDEIDVYGLTHPGLARKSNEDRFLIASLHKVMSVQHTNLVIDQLHNLTSASRGYLFLVADGVGGAAGGDRASETALRSVAEYVTNAMRFYYHHDPENGMRILGELQRSVLHVHEVVRSEHQGSATTLTMALVLWPMLFLVQVGDSRCYRLRQGKLEQLSRDQTMAQALIDSGALTPEDAEQTKWKHVLSSAVGGSEATPIASPHGCQWDDVLLICSDGLTKHVHDEGIESVLREEKSSEAACHALVKLALEGGGSDNVTVVVGRLRDRRGAEREESKPR
jgi:serine/threonine protein phosphatase PrpC